MASNVVLIKNKIELLKGQLNILLSRKEEDPNDRFISDEWTRTRNRFEELISLCEREFNTGLFANVLSSSTGELGVSQLNADSTRWDKELDENEVEKKPIGQKEKKKTLKPFGIFDKYPPGHFIHTYKTTECPDGENCPVLIDMEEDESLCRDYILQCPYYHTSHNDRVREGLNDIALYPIKCIYHLGHGSNVQSGEKSQFCWYNTKNPNKSCGYLHGVEHILLKYKQRDCTKGEDCELYRWEYYYEDMEVHGSCPCPFKHVDDRVY